MIALVLGLVLAVPGPDSGTQPEMVGPGVISTEFNEFGGAVTLDGDTLYFSRSVPRSYAYVILRSHRTPGGWSTPSVAPFSGRWRDHDPIIAPDGQRMYFVSDRPIGGVRQTIYRIWVMKRTPTGWTEPHPLGAPFEQFGFLWFISETRDGVVYFNVQPQDGPARIYTTRRTGSGYTTPELLPPEINIPDWDAREPYIAPDDSFMVFDAGPAGNVDAYDLYVSDHNNGAWTPARKLEALSSPTRDYSPRITADGQWLYFTSERGFADAPRDRALTYDEVEQSLHSVLNGLGNIYRVPIAAVHASACDAAEYHQFDFWIGDWTVTTPNGKVAGTNTIDRPLGTCVLQEHWVGAGGTVGSSFNVYDTTRKRWHQTWVDNQGTLLLLDGAFADEKMVMSGASVDAKGAAIMNRITWQREHGDPDRVRQLWETSADGGKTWQTAFDGLYTRKTGK